MQITVNGKEMHAEANETILTVLKRNNIHVPTLCHISGLLPSGACRICVVENEVNGQLIPSCSFPVSDGMKIRTHSQKAVAARKMIVELLLANHPDDCLYCDRNNNCELQSLAAEFGVRQRRITGKKDDYIIDVSSPSIRRDPAKCILCGKCVRVCEEVQGVGALDFTSRGAHTLVAPAFRECLNVSSCVNCGQCVNACPTAALTERSAIQDVINALQDKDKIVVIQHAPAVSVSLAEEFDLEAGTEIAGKMTAALRRIGFDFVFDTSFSADLTIMEEATELVSRIKENKPLPMITSCSPAWIKFAETFYPEFIPNLSTCKSPQQMLGALIKSYFAEKRGIDPSKIFSVSVMPCTAKKFEAEREEMLHKGIQDIDAVLTTRELAKLIRMYSIELPAVTPEEADLPFGERTSAGKLFGASGGVMEAALRTAYWMLTGKELENLVISEIRGEAGIKEVSVAIAGLTVKAAVASGLMNARKLLEQIKAGRKDIHFIEVMSCPGGCINGGGQPRSQNKENIRRRMAALYEIDSKSAVRTSHNNGHIKKLYEQWLGEPNSHRAHELLHTKYQARNVLK